MELVKSLLKPGGSIAALGGQWAARRRAAGAHLALSAVVVGVIITWAASQWYPGPLKSASGMLELTLVLALVDVVIGPFLTLVLYRPGKKGLKFDLAVIALVQLSALGYGVHTVFEARPVFYVFAIDRFEILSAAEMEPGQLAQARAPFNRLPLDGPKMVTAVPPSDPEERQTLMMSATMYGVDLKHFPKYYVPYDSAKHGNLSRAKPLEQLNKYNDPARVERELARLGKPAANLAYFPVSAKRRDLSAIVDRTTGDVLTITDLKPWD